jgi:KUP system potassium uptake protein
MRLSYFPHIKVVHTSKRFHEQVYMPMANWLLMIGTVIVTAVYNNVRSSSAHLSAPYRSRPRRPSRVY